MTARVWDDAVEALANFRECLTDPYDFDHAIADLRATADAVEGAIRAELSAAIASVLNGNYHDSLSVEDAIDDVLADPESVARHNAAIWDEGWQAQEDYADGDYTASTNPYNGSEQPRTGTPS